MGIPQTSASFTHPAHTVAIGSALVATITALALAILLRSSPSMNGVIACCALETFSVTIFVISVLTLRRKGEEEEQKSLSQSAAQSGTTREEDEFYTPGEGLTTPTTRPPQHPPAPSRPSARNDREQISPETPHKAPARAYSASLEAEREPLGGRVISWRLEELTPRVEEFKQTQLLFAQLRSRFDPQYKWNEEYRDIDQVIEQLETAIENLFQPVLERGNAQELQLYHFVLETLLSDGVGSIRDLQSSEKAQLKGWAPDFLVKNTILDRQKACFKAHPPVPGLNDLLVELGYCQSPPSSPEEKEQLLKEYFWPISQAFFQSGAGKLFATLTERSIPTLRVYAKGKEFGECVDHILDALRKSKLEGRPALQKLNALLAEELDAFS